MKGIELCTTAATFTYNDAHSCGFLTILKCFSTKDKSYYPGGNGNDNFLVCVFFFFFSTLVELDFRIEDVATQAGRMA